MYILPFNDMKTYKNYIFDLYGTLCSIETDEQDLKVWKVLTDRLKDHNIEYKPQLLKKEYEERIKENTNHNKEIDLMILFQEMFPTLSQNEIQSLLILFRTTSRKHLDVYNHTYSLLNKLKQHNRNIYLLSNAQSVFTIPELNQLHLLEYFNDIYISSEFGEKKPSLLFIDSLMSDYQLNKEETVMIGNDFSSDIIMANRYGMDAIFINTDHLKEKEIRKQKRTMDTDHSVICIHDLLEIEESLNG